MKFLVIELQTFEGGAMSTPAYAYDDMNSAEAKYHTILAAAAKSALPIHACVIMNAEGRLIKNECFYHEPVEEEENE